MYLNQTVKCIVKSNKLVSPFLLVLQLEFSDVVATLIKHGEKLIVVLECLTGICFYVYDIQF